MKTLTLFENTNETTMTEQPTGENGREFELALRRLIRRRLSGELSFEQFAKENLELHFRFGRPGYDVEQYERDMAEHRERLARQARRQKLDEALRPDDVNPRRAMGA